MLELSLLGERVIVWWFFQKCYFIIIPMCKNESSLRSCCHDFLRKLFLFSRQSDINLVEIGSDVVKDEDRAALLEGGALQSGSPKARSLTASPSIIRFVIHPALVLLAQIMVL